MRLVVADCSVDYVGKLSAHLPPATRLILQKADGSVSVHADDRAYKPLNWMSPPCGVREDTDADGVGTWTVTNKGGAFDAVVRAQQALLLDRHFLAPAYHAVAAGAPAPAGVALAVGQSSLRFERLPAYLRARAEDVRGLGKLLVRALLGEPLAVALPERPYVLACAELDAATALGLDPELCGGVLNWMGSLQGHGALMCAELGIGIRTRYLPARDLVEGELVELGLEP